MAATLDAARARTLVVALTTGMPERQRRRSVGRVVMTGDLA